VWQRDQVRTAYLAGPMRGIEDFNYPLFNAVAAWLTKRGYKIENPAQTDGAVSERASQAKNPLSVYMERDLADVAKTDAVFVLPGWEDSEGANIEVTIAWMLQHPVYSLPDFKLVEPYVLKAPVGLDFDFGPSWRDVFEDTGLNKGRREAIFTTIPVYALVQEARVHGNSVVPKDGVPAKYGDVEPGVPNWSLGGPYSWMLDALWRHLLAWQAGIDFDGESGLHNLAHVRWMCGTLMEWQRRGVGLDDRFGGQS
jgi:hypothetical protein